MLLRVVGLRLREIALGVLHELGLGRFVADGKCPPRALNGRRRCRSACPLSGAKRTQSDAVRRVRFWTLRGHFRRTRWSYDRSRQKHQGKTGSGLWRSPRAGRDQLRPTFFVYAPVAINICADN